MQDFLLNLLAVSGQESALRRLGNPAKKADDLQPN